MNQGMAPRPHFLELIEEGAGGCVTSVSAKFVKSEYVLIHCRTVIFAFSKVLQLERALLSFNLS